MTGFPYVRWNGCFYSQKYGNFADHFLLIFAIVRLFQQ